jgi:two-component system CheB/CheR fusion protein
METKRRNTRTSLQPSCVVGIGASAGGLEALQQLLTYLPSNTGMAFVIIQHLAPNHKSLLSEILAKYTVMPVIEAKNGMRVEKNHIYMIPPRYNIEIESDTLRLEEYDHTKINHPVDIFFRSLAVAYENRSIAVILSGTGSDGTNGIRSIKEANGLIIVQSPDSAKFDGMPRNAISTGIVDMIRNPENIAREMAHIASSIADTSAKMQLSDNELLSRVFSILKQVTNINYQYYKQTTILRRIERRLVVTHNTNLREYVTYLSKNPDEARVLAKEVLIGVTCFFRDPEYFETLKQRVIKELIRNGNRSDQIRVWVAGCSTGEEAYSIAILFMEAMEELDIRKNIKIFATDLDGDAINKAGRGIYGDNIIEDVSVSRLSRYFTRKGNKYVVRHDLRTMIIFAQHNVFQDPPFGKLDLISCRNLLIYFQTVLQRNLFSIFHVALKDKAYLFLGRSESVFDYDDVYRVLSANEKIFVHNASGKLPVHEKMDYSMQTMDHTLEPVYSPVYDMSDEISYKPSELETGIFEEFMPACALIDEKNDIWRTYGDIATFLVVPVGVMTSDIFTMVREDLKIAVSTVVRESRLEMKKVTYESIPIEITPGRLETIAISASPVLDKRGERTDYTAVVFIREKREFAGDVRHYQIDSAASQRITNLENELKVAQENLRQTVTELESVNAELQAANEELLTANEELQSSNEELQSVNEELYTVNSEYQIKVNELAAVNEDMANFLSTTLVGILMVDRKLNIRKFTEYIAEEFNIVEQDVGRSLRYLSFHFGTIDLVALSQEVLATMKPIEKHCASISGKTYLIRIAPYNVTEKAQDILGVTEPLDVEAKGKQLKGLVLTFMDNTKQVDDQEQIEEMGKALRMAVKSSKEKETFLSHMSHDMRTPMTAILGLTQLELAKKDLPGETLDSLKKIEISSRYLMGLIDEILETSRINAGKVIVLNSTVRENALSSAISGMIKEQAREAGLDFRFEIKGSSNRYVLMDTEHAERILMNLLSNAIKYTPEKGKVSLLLDVYYENDQAVHTYHVTDTGRGISKSFQNYMFLPFEQETASTDVREGTGLGLYICKSLVDLLGGTITYSSEIGKGSEFVVTLRFDLATEEQIRLSNRETRNYEDQLLFGKNVLVAEDNHIIAEVIVKILGTKGIHAEIARDGQEVIELFRNQGPYYYQAILMDIMMPVKNGLQATREIRQMGTADSSNVPIIALTADVEDETESRCYDAGMNACIVKPIESEQLLSLLAKEFEEKSMRILAENNFHKGVNDL